MITKVVINNNGDTPIEYLSGLGAFRNGKTYEFKSGVNIIVGKNGCGKTTLMDEPDRNLDIENIGHIKAVLDFHKPQSPEGCQG